MIARYTHPEMGGIWSDERRYATWLKVEIAAAEAMAEQGIIPAEAARAIRERGAFDVARIEAIEEVTRHDIIAFTTAVAEHVGPEARWLHFGLTSSDVARHRAGPADAGRLRPGAQAPRGAARGRPGRALEHRRTPMIGRTHGVHAEPTTLGLKLALWYEEIGRDIERVQRRPRDHLGRQDLRRRRHLRAPRSRRSNAPSARSSASSRRPCRRRSSSATGTRSCWPLWRSPPPRSRSSPSRSAACRRPRSAKSRSPSPRARRARRPCRTSATRSGASRSSGLARVLRGNLGGGARERGPLARARHLALVGRADHPARQLHRPRPHAPALHADRRRHGGVPGPDAPQPRAAPRRGLLRLGAARAGVAGRRRASRRTSGCSATRCGRRSRVSTSATCCAATGTWRPCFPPRISIDSSISITNSATSTRCSGGCSAKARSEAMLDKLKDECGVFGIYGHAESAKMTYLGLYALQHRGQESGGIVASDGLTLRASRGMGYVADVFGEHALADCRGPRPSATCATRRPAKAAWSTRSRSSSTASTGPIAVCHNGNLVNERELRAALSAQGAIFQTSSDTEVFLHLYARSQGRAPRRRADRGRRRRRRAHSRCSS